jgi:hypothetical protein
LAVDSQDPRHVLARRLRDLREVHFLGRKVNQSELAEALGGDGRRSLSVPSISSWESQTNPKVPPADRIRDIATFFASPRSLHEGVSRLLSIDEMTAPERVAREQLLDELTRLRREALDAAGASGTRAAIPGPRREIGQSLGAGPYRFTENQDITIVCAQLPQELLERMPYTDPLDPDFIELYRYSELDSLFELYGHLRATNPTTQVNLRLAHELESDDYSAHLISLGGVDWNLATRSVLDSLELPVRQVNEWNKPGGAYFEVTEADGSKVAHRPSLEESSGRLILREDVALFARAVNPDNQKRSVTICNGMYGSGSLGAVRALTDARFRDRNAEYLKQRFGDSDAYCILTRVRVRPGTRSATVTPDWTLPEWRLFEWSRL